MDENFNTQPHRRYNILTGKWVLVSPHRNRRPWQGKQESIVAKQLQTFDEHCYLCPGNTRASGHKNPDYKNTYSFTNDYAALIDGSIKTFTDGLLTSETETGICKVICFSPNHSLTLPLMSIEEITDVVKLWKTEFEELSQKEEINYVQIFENKGAVMGCSNPHPHGQIWSQYSIPVEIEEKTKSQNDYYKTHGKSLLKQYLDEELQKDERIIYKNEHFVALVPFWAVWPYEVMILPIKQLKNISELGNEEEVAFAEIIKIVTTKYDNLFNVSFPYSSGWHFHMSFYPPLLRSATVKKFMVGYELFAMPQRDITAEQAAKTLRELPNTHYTKRD